jgi:hypothetical protein
METTAIREFARKNVIELYYGAEKDMLEELERNRKEIMPLIDELLKGQR